MLTGADRNAGRKTCPCEDFVPPKQIGQYKHGKMVNVVHCMRTAWMAGLKDRRLGLLK